MNALRPRSKKLAFGFLAAFALTILVPGLVSTDQAVAADSISDVDDARYTYEEVFDRCTDRYDRRDQQRACVSNICRTYGCE